LHCCLAECALRRRLVSLPPCDIRSSASPRPDAKLSPLHVQRSKPRPGRKGVNVPACLCVRAQRAKPPCAARSRRPSPRSSLLPIMPMPTRLGLAVHPALPCCGNGPTRPDLCGGMHARRALPPMRCSRVTAALLVSPHSSLHGLPFVLTNSASCRPRLIRLTSALSAPGISDGELAAPLDHSPCCGSASPMDHHPGSDATPRGSLCVTKHRCSGPQCMCTSH
jgi:hypothetical protein